MLGLFYIGRKSLEPVKRYEHLAGIQAKEPPLPKPIMILRSRGETSNDGPEIELAYRDLLNATSI